MTRTGPRTVAVVLHEPQLGGASQSVIRAVPLLEERGWRFVFWTPRPSALFDELVGAGHQVDGAPRSIEYSLRAWRLPPGPRRRLASLPTYLAGFHRFLSDHSPALVHANSIMTVAEALVARRQGVPALLHVHEMLPHGARGRLLRRLAWRRLDEVVAVSEASAVPLAYRGTLPRVVHEAAPVPPNPVPVRPHPRPFTVGTVGVISTRKGSDLFVEAACLLLARSEEFRFEMVGAPNDALERDWARSLLARAVALGIEHRPSADVFERFAHWDAFALPSRSDPFPIAMLEAMASGLPVIGARRDGIIEQLDDDAGVLVRPEDPAALAAAISWLASRDAEARKAMGASARARVAAHFTLERQAEGMHAAYLAAVGGHGAPALPVAPRRSSDR